MATTLTCVILAGGRSRRMGQDKALLKLPNGQCLLSRTVEVASGLSLSCGKSLTPKVAIVTPWPDRYRAVLSPTIEPSIQWIEDTETAGPLVGFMQAWSVIDSDWCLLLACDLPNLETQVLQRWWRSLALVRTSEQNPPVAASLVKNPKGWEPLCGYYHRSCIAGLKQPLAAGDASDASVKRLGQRDFQSWLATLRIAPYSAVPKEMLFNCNRPADWAKITAAIAE